MNTRTDILFDSTKMVNRTIHIIGCGAVGSHLAIQLIKLGITRLKLWDFDTIEEHNLTNQIWNHKDIGKSKVEALIEHILELDPYIPPKNIKNMGKYEDQALEGIVFACVDSVELRKHIYECNQYAKLEIMFDPRLGSTTGSVFTYLWTEQNAEKLINLSDFKDDEIDVQRSLCGTPVNINSTLLMVVNCMLINFINYINEDPFYNQIYFEPLKYKTTYLNN